MGNENCYKCSTVQGCLQECNQLSDSFSVSNWANCKTQCNADFSGKQKIQIHNVQFIRIRVVGVLMDAIILQEIMQIHFMLS